MRNKLTASIHRYAKEGNLAQVCDELAKCVQADLRDPVTGRTPLMEAVTGSRNLDIVRLLIQHNADVNAVARKPGIPKVDFEQISAILESKDFPLPEIPNLDKIKEILKCPASQVAQEETVLSLALNAGDFQIIKTLLDSGANIHYIRPHNYDALIDAVTCKSIVRDDQLVSIILLLIHQGAALNTVTDYSESALSIASNNGRFDVIRLLLGAGADAGPLQWTPLMHVVAFGTLPELEAELKKNADLSARDFWSRTPWLLSLQVGDVAKARLLLATGASRTDRGRCGKAPLMYPIINGHADMLRWLLSEGFDPNDTDEFQGTPLLQAAEAGETECVRILLDAGADIHRVQHGDNAIRRASKFEIVQLLVERGADINEISNEMRASLTHTSTDGFIACIEEDYATQKHRQFGHANPEKMNFPFWRAMVASGLHSYAARQNFSDTDRKDGAVWCFKRFGKSINLLPDGRIIEIAGEHEDYYDPDFCIYNDVVVHHPDCTFDIYGYPKDVFPPTDFHTATLSGDFIYIIGSLGYQEERHYGQTPVSRLNLKTFEIQKLTTSGDPPGWIHRHRATHGNTGQIRISGGKICALENGTEVMNDNLEQFVLDLETLVWQKVH